MVCYGCPAKEAAAMYDPFTDQSLPKLPVGIQVFGTGVVYLQGAEAFKRNRTNRPLSEVVP
jgi:hypothetical protein